MLCEFWSAGWSGMFPQGRRVLAFNTTVCVRSQASLRPAAAIPDWGCLASQNRRRETKLMSDAQMCLSECTSRRSCVVCLCVLAKSRCWCFHGCLFRRVCFYACAHFSRCRGDNVHLYGRKTSYLQRASDSASVYRDRREYHQLSPTDTRLFRGCCRY